MKMNYCMECGTLLHPMPHGEEGIVPYCDTCAAFRCYLMAPGTAGARTRGSGAALPESMRVVLKGADGSITGIGTIDTMTGEATLDGNGPWYTLGGQYLQGKPSRPGIYIHNGKKVVIK